MVQPVGFEPTTYSLEGCCSSNWATAAKYFLRENETANFVKFLKSLNLVTWFDKLKKLLD